MKKIIALSLSVFLFGCVQQGINTVPVELINGATIEFPAANFSRVEGMDINFYGETGYLGFVNKEYLPLEQQPATDFIKRGLSMTKAKGWEIKEVSKGRWIGYIVYVEDSATMHLAISSNSEIVFSISTKKELIEEVLATLKTDQ